LARDGRLDRPARHDLAAALGVPGDPDRLDKQISQLRSCTTRRDVAPLPGQLRAGEHSDSGMMTLITATTMSAGFSSRPRRALGRCARRSPTPSMVNLWAI